MAAPVNNTPGFQAVNMTNFKNKVDLQVRDFEGLKDNQITAANNLPELENRTSNVINMYEAVYPNLAAQWRQGVPFPPMTPDPLPGLANPDAQQLRTMQTFERINNAELFEREMHHYLVAALHTAAAPLYQRSMEVNQPQLEVPYTPDQVAEHALAVADYNAALAAHPAALLAAAALVPPGPVPPLPIVPAPLPPRQRLPAKRGIFGQSLREAWAKFCERVGKPVSVNVNLLELKLKMETQPADMDLMTHFSMKVEEFEVLRELGRDFENEGRPNEAADIVLNTIVDPKYKDFKRDYLIAHYSDDRRTMATLAHWITTRAWACEQDHGAAQHRGLMTSDDNDDTMTALARAQAGRGPAAKAYAKPQAVNKDPPITTSIDISSISKATLSKLGFKLVPIDKMHKPAGTTPAGAAPAGGRPSPPPTPNPRKQLYCWSHGMGSHAGTQCNSPKDGHQDRATVTNKMGGSERGCKK